MARSLGLTHQTRRENNRLEKCPQPVGANRSRKQEMGADLGAYPGPSENVLVGGWLAAVELHRRLPCPQDL